MGCCSCDVSTVKVCEGAEACTSHDDAGSSGVKKLPPCSTCSEGTEAHVPSYAKPLSPISKTNHCNYCKTVATDGRAGPSGGTNTVDCHACGIWRGIRCDIYPWTEGSGVVGS